MRVLVSICVIDQDGYRYGSVQWADDIPGEDHREDSLPTKAHAVATQMNRKLLELMTPPGMAMMRFPPRAVESPTSGDHEHEQKLRAAEDLERDLSGNPDGA